MRTVVDREAEFDEEQYSLAVALNVYEASLNELGIPIVEATSPLADPNNPKGEWTYRAGLPVRDWSLYALEMEQKKPEWSGDNYLRSRHFPITRVER